MNNIFLMEDKYKGNLYLLAVPYKKSMIVAVKYILGLLITILEMFIYFLLSRITLTKYSFREGRLNSHPRFRLHFWRCRLF